MEVEIGDVKVKHRTELDLLLRGNLDCSVQIRNGRSRNLERPKLKRVTPTVVGKSAARGSLGHVKNSTGDRKPNNCSQLSKQMQMRNIAAILAWNIPCQLL
jgi:hypothetical protein